MVFSGRFWDIYVEICSIDLRRTLFICFIHMMVLLKIVLKKGKDIKIS